MDDIELNLETCKAIDGDRRASLAMFERVAKGDFSLEVTSWLQQVANAVLDAESKPASRNRDSAVMRALGLAGNVDKHRELREFVSVLRDFGCDRPARVRAAKSGVPPVGIEVFVSYDPSTYKGMDEADLVKLIDAELAKISPKT